jgi:signal transduction histidine kinase
VKRSEPVEGITIRAALFVAFTLLLVLWLLSGYYFSTRVAAVEREATAINTRYMTAQELLSTVRTQILVASVLVRDALLDPDRGTTAAYRLQVDDAFSAVDDALTRYVPVLDSQAEGEHVAQLRQAIEQFRKTLDEVLDSDRTRWPIDAGLLLSSQIVPRRQGVLRVSEEIQALNRNAFVQQQSAMSTAYAMTQRRIWRQLGVALAVSFAIGLFALRFVARLESRLRRQLGTNAETSQDLQRLSAQLISVQEEERRTIARELHDEVGQVLTAVKVELMLAQRQIEGTGRPVDRLTTARTVTEGALHTVRNLSHLLHPAVLDDLGLPSAVNGYLKEVADRHGIRIELLQDGMTERLSQEVETAAYRVVQEALTNVVKHAQATVCRVYLQRLANTLSVTIEDDGVGFDAPAILQAGARAGLGLVGIRERVALVGGTLRLDSGPLKGTRLTVELPARALPSSGSPLMHERGGTHP